MTRGLRLAMLDPTLTPYRVHFHRRVVTELPGVRLWSLHLHDRDFLPWSMALPAELEAVSFDAPGRRGLAGSHADLARLRLFARWLDANPVDAVVLGGYGDLARTGALALCARRGLPCFLFGDSNSQGDIARGAKRWAKRTVLPSLLRLCAGVLTCGTRGREYFRAYGVPDHRIFLCPYEPDYALFGAVPPGSAAAARERWGLSAERSRLLFSGRLVHEKRVDLLIDAFAALALERPDWDLVVVGEGPLGADLIRRVPPRLRDRVLFTGFVDPPPELAALYSACDVLVVPSDFEPWGVVVNEALAAGLALVCSDVVGARADLVLDGVNGRVFRAGDEASLVAALRDVTDPTRLTAMKAASAHVLADWRRRADPVEGLVAALESVGVSPRRLG